MTMMDDDDDDDCPKVHPAVRFPTYTCGMMMMMMMEDTESST